MEERDIKRSDFVANAQSLSKTGAAQTSSTDAKKENINEENRHGKIKDVEALADFKISNMHGNREKHKKWFNIVDLIVVISLMATVLCGILQFNPFESIFGNGDKVTLEYVVLLENVDEIYAASVQKGDVVKFNDDLEMELGLISSTIDVTPYAVPTLNGDAVVMNEVPGRVSLTFTVRVDTATYQDEIGYQVGDIRIAVGSELPLITPSLLASATVISLNKIS